MPHCIFLAGEVHLESVDAGGSRSSGPAHTHLLNLNICMCYVCMYVCMYICICFFSQCADAEEHLADDSLGEFVHH